MTPRRALLIALVTLLASTGACALVLTSDRAESKLATLLLAVPIGIAFVFSGLLAWWRRPENRTGMLMVLTGLLWYIGALAESDHSLLWTLSNALGAVPYVVLLHLVLAYPTGRLDSRAARWVVGIAYASLPLDSLGLLVDDLRDACADCPENAFLVRHVDALATGRLIFISALSVAILLATFVILVQRWRRATPALRRTLAPVYLSGGVVFALLVAAFTLGQVSERVSDVIWVLLFLALVSVPLSFLAGLLRTRLARAGAARVLLETVPDEPTLEEAEAGLRRALRDPTLRLLFWSSRTRGYVDAQGRNVDLPESTEERVTTKIEYENRPLAALVHDATLLEEPDLLEDVIATARVALEKDRTLRTLRRTEIRTHALLDAIPDNMFRVTRDGGYLDASIKDERYLPVPAEQLPNTTVHDVLPPDVARLIQDSVARALDTGEVQTVEYRMQRPVGLRDSEARIVASGEDEAVIIVRDITERKAADAELRRLNDELEARAVELQHERDLLGTVVNTSPAFFCGVDPDGRIVRFNTALQLLSGRTDDETTRGQRFWETFVVPDERGAFETRFRDAIKGPAKVEHENRWVNADGEPAVVAWSAAWYPGEGGADRYLISGSDVTERHRHAAELERERNFLNAIANNAPSLLCLIDDHGRVTDRASNVAFEQTLDYKTAETGGHVFWEKYVHPDDADDVRERIERIVAGEQLGEQDSRWVSRTGRTFLVAWSCTPLPRIDERRLFLMSGTDVTQRKRQELELERQRDLLQAVGDATPSLLVVIGPDGRVGRDGVNLAARTMTGFEQLEVDGLPFWDVFPPPEEADRVRALVEHAVATGEAHEYETRWVGKSGEPRLVAWSCTRMPDLDRSLVPERDPAGLPVSYLVAGTDVTERARQRDELRRERDFLSTVANATPTFMCVVDANGRVTEEGVNRAFGENTGYGDAEARGRLLTNLVVPEEDREEFAAALAEVAAGGPTIRRESRWQTSTGEQLLVEWVSIPLAAARENQFLIAAVDVTRRKRQEEELRRERDFGHTVTDTIPSLLLVVDAEWRVSHGGVNRAAEQLLGYAEDELVGKSFLEAVVPSDTAGEIRAWLEAVKTGGSSGERDSHWLTAAGERRLIAWSCTALPAPGAPELFLVSGLDITERRRQEEEIRKSRARIVEAADTERRRLERNLHDGAQQRLVSLSLSLRRAQAKLSSDPEYAGQILSDASAELAHALEELRELARGIHPAVLTDRGLGPALESLVHRAPIRVQLDALPAERLPGPVEAAAFYVVSEALANVAKYAGASAASVRIERRDGTAFVEVADDGVGGADPTRGTGLRGLADRVEALDGRLDVQSEPGAGTVVRAEIPVSS